ncbi:hypothetical protein [Nocardia implantans]|uniref:Uncharacterized protein n=1 Tax=Nocardia implantans TaxID=3108168 RepID=A0ABU6AWM4_9NOCA|nr:MULTISPECIES: hypothetical protein [unclassified Nocardia]MBF6193966.1 hypothetical protein [Nocardia beijingensis]MEA3529295.1 hypothetical protein [Nocardia sp. CDC192]MEB3511881.1 hypothetical protein [Nocardia sp. CDC186]
MSNEIRRIARADAEHGVRPIAREARDAAQILSDADRGFRHAFDPGDPSFPRPLVGSGSTMPDRFYNGARLWQVDQVFPRAFRGRESAPEEGYIRTASHSTAGDVVYLTDGSDIAGVYGTITSWTDVRDGTMRFHPAGMVLGVDANRIRVDPMLEEGHSAANYLEGVSDRVFTTPGRVDTSKIVSVEFQTYDDIIDNPDVTLVADGFPGFDGLRQESLRDPAVVAERLSAIADAVRRNYPTIDVTVSANHLSSEEAIRTFLAT